MSEILTCDRGFQFDAEVPTNTDIFTGEPYADCADMDAVIVRGLGVVEACRNKSNLVCPEGCPIIQRVHELNNQG
ncbi:hypothetical protein A2714_04290 [Candidatus Woesebacteria bacterium RIFCSPHIGHO2_01_FULL_38_9]|uniref:Uncharacterized protein n=2 Tax=Candidatus Woeseibacteriota TaxID=1752722 RepID=A0A1F7XY23_9BACT|nr:MAG: hypothetical protein A2714_04290 [Candidatus Woesebacteria bacterium RIFCSPHIGHO2_01_FULL_38_9]OGM58967.1 MAG: hypothetical protein A3A75_00435 [Candidatus Woesebacteria bacterium RIFCSPLOWO2_01_FULL_39_10]